jgi:hypothetical protein
MFARNLYPEQLFELIYARCVTLNDYPDLSSTILTLQISNLLKRKWGICYNGGPNVLFISLQGFVLQTNVPISISSDTDVMNKNKYHINQSWAVLSVWTFRHDILSYENIFSIAKKIYWQPWPVSNTLISITSVAKYKSSIIWDNVSK